MTRVKVEHGSVPSSAVATNAISLGNLAVTNPGNIQGSGAMTAGGNMTPGPSTLQNTQLFGTTIDCYENVFNEITKKLTGGWDETGGIAISDILDPSMGVATAQPIVYETSDLFRQDVAVATSAANAATLTANNGGAGGLAIITGQGTTGIPAGAILVQRRMQDDKGRIWTIDGLPQNGEQIAFTTVAAPSTSLALQQVAMQPQPQPPTLMDPLEPPLQQQQQEQLEQASSTTATSTEERWFESEETLSWTQSKIGRYNPAQKVFRCVDCDFIGFLSRVAEHWLGNHADYRVFQCPRCPYTSAWARCVRMHLTRQHGETLADNSLWKENPVLEEVTKYLTTLKTKVEQKISESASGEKRYSCPYCPYQTDRRDLYNRHENIHRDDKPFQCYVCDKQFNRADHVKKHFLRMHREHTYDINKIRKSTGKLNLQFANGRKVTSKQRKGMQAQSQVLVQQQQLLVGAGQLDPSLKSETMTQVNLEQNLGLPITQDILAVPVPVQIQSTNQTASVPHIAYFNPPPAPGQSGPLQGIPGVGGTKKEGKSKGHKKKKSGEKMYTCSYCPWQGVDNWCLKRHLNTHIKPFLCALCDYKAARSERLATHVLKVHNKRVCHKCSFLADDSESLSLHIQDSHQNPLVKTGFHCNICQEYFELRADLEAHAILEHQKVIVQCDLCDYRTTDELSMETHLRDKHNLTPGSGAVAAAAAAAAAAAIGQQMSPPFAQPQVQTQMQLEPSENLLTQTGGDILQTNAIAGPSSSMLGSFPSEPSVAQFSQSFDESEVDPDEPDTLCDKCGIDFLDEQSRKLHEKRHELVNPAEDEAVKGAKDATTKRFLRSYVCSTCSYTSSTKKLMMQHQRAHTGFELMCKAENCMFITPFDNTLKEHIQNDHGAEEHVRCPHCGLRMPSCNAFTTHWRFHHQSVCSLCVNVYRAKYDVKENEIHDVICKVSVPMSAISVASISDLESSLFFKMDSIDFPSLSLGDHDLVGLMGEPIEEPLLKRQKLDLPQQTSSIATLYRRESIKFLPRLVEVTVSPQPPKLKKMYSSKRKRRRQKRNRESLGDDHENTLAVIPSAGKSATNSSLNKYLQLMLKNEADIGVRPARVSLRRRYCQRGTFKWLFRNPREGYRCFNPLCDDRSSWRYPRKSGLALHNLWYHRMTRFNCDICGLRFSHLYKAYLHKINEHMGRADGMMLHDNVPAFLPRHPHIHSMNQGKFSIPGQSHILS